jgi:hypothetical protein
MHRFPALTAVTLGLIAVGAAPASAETRRFDVWTATSYTPGRAHAYGSVEFSGSAATVRGRLNDVCPKDGHGAYLRVTFVLGNGDTRQLSAKDTTGCSNADGVDITLHQAVAAGRTIRAVRLHLYEYDADRNSIADTADRRIRNP